MSIEECGRGMEGAGDSRARATPMHMATDLCHLHSPQDSIHFSLIIEMPDTNPPRYLHTGGRAAPCMGATALQHCSSLRALPAGQPCGSCIFRHPGLPLDMHPPSACRPCSHCHRQHCHRLHSVRPGNPGHPAWWAQAVLRKMVQQGPAVECLWRGASSCPTSPACAEQRRCACPGQAPTTNPHPLLSLPLQLRPSWWPSCCSPGA